MSSVYFHCIQCRDKRSGAVGDFIHAGDFVAMSPVFRGLIQLYGWMRENGWAMAGSTIADLRVAKVVDLTPQREQTSGNAEDGEMIGGIFVGKRIDEHLFAEEVASRRWVIRESDSSPRRVGEVMGGDGRFQAMRMDGSHVAMKASLREAARSLR